MAVMSTPYSMGAGQTRVLKPVHSKESGRSPDLPDLLTYQQIVSEVIIIR